MGLTRLVSLFLKFRTREIARIVANPEQTQMKLLMRQLKITQKTEVGKKYGFSAMRTYEDFASKVPVIDYEGLKPYVERLIAGEQNLVWHTPILWFAMSSGTTNDKSKYIPVSKEALNKCHYKAATDCLALYLKAVPKSRVLDGKALILGGSRSVNKLSTDIFYGDLSAVLIQNINPIVNLKRVPSKKTALMNDWEKKLEAITQETLHEDVTSLSGVPSWFLVLIKQVLAAGGKEKLHEIWPNLELFFHGGIGFEPYREQYNALIDSTRIHYMETYNASEGFFAVQDKLDEKGMLLLLDIGVFFEFIPMDNFEKDDYTAIPLWQTTVGKNYALVITTNGGLWRYIIGDTVMVVCDKPYKIVITGRTKHFINAFGEELMVANAEQALAMVNQKMGVTINNYTAAPVFMTANHAQGHHQWLIEFDKAPADLEDYTVQLDLALQSLNSDYEAKRTKSIALTCLQIVVAKPDLFNLWLAKISKLGGQNKIPRLANNRKIMEELLALNNE